MAINDFWHKNSLRKKMSLQLIIKQRAPFLIVVEFGGILEEKCFCSNLYGHSRQSDAMSCQSIEVVRTE